MRAGLPTTWRVSLSGRLVSSVPWKVRMETWCEAAMGCYVTSIPMRTAAVYSSVWKDVNNISNSVVGAEHQSNEPIDFGKTEFTSKSSWPMPAGETRVATGPIRPAADETLKANQRGHHVWPRWFLAGTWTSVITAVSESPVVEDCLTSTARVSRGGVQGRCSPGEAGLLVRGVDQYQECGCPTLW